MFHHDWTSHTSRPFQEGALYPTLTAEVLLKHRSYHVYKDKLREALAIDEASFHQMYQPLIDRFALEVQVLPETSWGAVGGFLGRALQRAFLIVQQRHELGLQGDDLLTFALFSAVLYLDIGALTSNLHVVLMNLKGCSQGVWHPGWGPMQSTHYTVWFCQPAQPNLERVLTPVLAGQIMHEAGWKWLSSDQLILAFWLALLNADQRQGKKVDEIFKRLSMWDEHDLKSIFEIEVKSHLLEEHAWIKDFQDWLNAGLKNGSISLTDEYAGVCVKEGGQLWLGAGLLIQFAEIIHRGQEWHVIAMHQLSNALGLAPLSGYDYKFKQHISEHPHRALQQPPSHFRARRQTLASYLAHSHPTKRGVMLTDPRVLLKQEQWHRLGLDTSTTYVRARQISDIIATVQHALMAQRESSDSHVSSGPYYDQEKP